MLKSLALWKMYFWAALTGFAASVPHLGPSTNWVFTTWLLIITETLSLIGLFAYAFKRPIFSSRFWRVFFWSILLTWNFPILYSLSPIRNQIFLPNFLENYLSINSIFFTPQMIAFITLGLLLGIPTFYAIYKEGYRHRK